MAPLSPDPCDKSPWFPPQSWRPCDEPAKRLSRWRSLSIQAKRHLPPPEPSREEDDRWLQRAAEQQRERKAAEAQRAAEDAKRHEEERAAAAEAALHADLESLPRVKSLTAEQFLALLGHDAGVRFEIATKLPRICATLVSLQSDAVDCEVRGILDCGYCEPGEIPDDIATQPVLAGYEENEARRYIAWAEAAEMFAKDEIHWLDFDEVLRLDDMLPELEAQSLEQQADELDQEAYEDSQLLGSLDHEYEVDPDALIDPGLEKAVSEERAGRRMRAELERQYHLRDVVLGGHEAIEDKEVEADKLRATAAALRKRVEEDSP